MPFNATRARSSIQVSLNICLRLLKTYIVALTQREGASMIKTQARYRNLLTEGLRAPFDSYFFRFEHHYHTITPCAFLPSICIHISIAFPIHPFAPGTCALTRKKKSFMKGATGANCSTADKHSSGVSESTERIGT